MTQVYVGPDKLPSAFPFWSPDAQDRFLERLAIVREANNIPDNQPAPSVLRQIAVDAAEEAIQAVIKMQMGGAK
jgi:hypothetical protein